MRQLKFRVYDKEMKRMHVCGANPHDNIYFTAEGHARYFNLQNGCGSSEEGTGTYVLMQSTELYDKAGTLIFEGDIIEIGCDLHPPQNCEVVFSRGLMGVNYIDEWESGIVGLAGYCEYWITKVVGNKWETPELLPTETAEP